MDTTDTRKQHGPVQLLHVSAEVKISGTLFTSGFDPPNSALIPYSSVLLQHEHYMIIKSLLLCLLAVFAEDIISGESHLQF